MSQDQFPIRVVQYSVRKWMRFAWLLIRGGRVDGASMDV